MSMGGMGGGGGGGIEGVDVGGTVDKANSVLADALERALGYSEDFTDQAVKESRSYFNDAINFLNASMREARQEAEYGFQRSQALQAPYKEAGYFALDKYLDTIRVARPEVGSSRFAHALENQATWDKHYRKIEALGNMIAGAGGGTAFNFPHASGADYVNYIRYTGGPSPQTILSSGLFDLYPEWYGIKQAYAADNNLSPLTAAQIGAQNPPNPIPSFSSNDPIATAYKQNPNMFSNLQSGGYKAVPLPTGIFTNTWNGSSPPYAGDSGGWNPRWQQLAHPTAMIPYNPTYLSGVVPGSSADPNFWKQLEYGRDPAAWYDDYIRNGYLGPLPWEGIAGALQGTEAYGQMKPWQYATQHVFDEYMRDFLPILHDFMPDQRLISDAYRKGLMGAPVERDVIYGHAPNVAQDINLQRLVDLFGGGTQYINNPNQNTNTQDPNDEDNNNEEENPVGGT